jgi:hypothetical protein
MNTLTGNALMLIQTTNEYALQALSLLNKHHCEQITSFYQTTFNALRGFRLQSTTNPRKPLGIFSELLNTVKDAKPAIITDKLYFVLFIDILPRDAYRDLIIDFQQMIDRDDQCSLQKIIHRTINYYENQVKDNAERQANNAENTRIRANFNNDKLRKSLNNAGVVK